MSYQFQLIVLIILIVLVLVISLTKRTWKESLKKSGLKKITIYGYFLIGLAIIIIIGLFWNLKRFKEVETTSSSITQKFDDTLYSLSKQIIAHNLSYDKQTNKIKPRYVEAPGLKQFFNWQINRLGSKSEYLISDLSLFNTGIFPVVNIKGKIFFFRMMGNQFKNTYKSYDLFSYPGLPPRYSTFSANFIMSIDSAYNLFYTKVEYEDEDGFSKTPIRQIYIVRNASGEPIQPRLILTDDSIDIVNAYLKKNNIW